MISLKHLSILCGLLGIILYLSSPVQATRTSEEVLPLSRQLVQLAAMSLYFSSQLDAYQVECAMAREDGRPAPALAAYLQEDYIKAFYARAQRLGLAMPADPGVEDLREAVAAVAYRLREEVGRRLMEHDIGEAAARLQYAPGGEQ